MRAFEATNYDGRCRLKCSDPDTAWTKDIDIWLRLIDFLDTLFQKTFGLKKKNMLIDIRNTCGNMSHATYI